MDEPELIKVSPRHSVRLAQEYSHLIGRAPQRDFVVRNLVRRDANGLPLMTAELVIAGRETRERFPLASLYPLHFRKTYFPGRFHADPETEFQRHSRAVESIHCLRPLAGRARRSAPVFSRANLTPPVALRRRAGREQPGARAGNSDSRLPPLAARKKLLFNSRRFMKAASRTATWNCTTSSSVRAIGVGAHRLRQCCGTRKRRPRAWEKGCARDFTQLLREAVFLQCALGRQPGPLADLAWQRMDEFLKAPERFRREIAQPVEVKAGGES